MSKCRVIGAGAGIGRANGGGGYNTGGNQGGGDALEGLVSTTNMRVALVPYVRTRADGGNARNWVFCMNQLGGVGRRWGQAAGPGNRGGVHASCKDQAMRSRQRYPMRPKQSSGYGSSKVHRANAVLPKLGAAPLVSEEVTLPNFGGYYGVPEYRLAADGNSAVALGDPPGNPVQIEDINSAYNVLVLGCISFEPTPFGPNGIPPTLSNVTLTLRVPAGDPLVYKILTITVTNSAWAYSDGVTGDSQDPSTWDVDPTPQISTTDRSAYNSFKNQLGSWLKGSSWRRPRRALISIGTANPEDSVTLPKYDTHSVSDGGAGTVAFGATSPSALQYAPPTALYRAALNLAYLMKDLCPDELEVADCMGLDVTTRSTRQASALQDVKPLADAFPSLNTSKYETVPYLRCSPGGIPSDALGTLDVRSLLLDRCNTLAYPTAWIDPGSLADGNLAIAPDLWKGFSTDAPTSWSQPGTGSASGICAAIWLAKEATAYLSAKILLRHVSVAATIDTGTTKDAPAAIPPGQGISWYDSKGACCDYTTLISSFGDSNTRRCDCGGDDDNGPCPSVFVMSIERETYGGAGLFTAAAQKILNNLGTASCSTETGYTVTGNPAVEGTYMQATPNQKAPTTSFAPHAYVRTDATDETAALTLWSECTGSECTRPRWFLSYVNLTSGAPDITATTQNPVYFMVCTNVDTCKTVPQTLRSDTPGADLITVTKIT